MTTLPYVQDPELHEFYDYGSFKESNADLQSAPTVYMDRKADEQFQNDIEDSYDVDDQSEVPSMTRGSSSRSASSSIIICPCENSSEKCQCQPTSNRAYSEMEFTSMISRTHSPSGLPQHERLKSLKSLLQPVTSGSISTVKASRALFLTPPPTMGWKSDISPPSTYQVDRIPSEHPDVFYNDQQAVRNPQKRDNFEESEDDDEISDSEEEVLSDQLTDFNDDLEALVLQAVGGDLELAAYLIPIFHKLQYTETLANITQKIDSWHSAINKCSPGTGAGQTPSSNARSPDGNGSARKRRRGLGSDQPIKESQDDDAEDDDDDDDEDNQNSKGAGEDGNDGASRELPRLACPFNKIDPVKYGIQHGASESNAKSQYRICAGPGFSSIQRLKEHLKRKHYPVQCDRCYAIFPGADRAACVTALEAHRQQAKMCERKEAILKEGISDAQWAQLDKKRSAKHSKSLSRIDKYWEIWDIIFPGHAKPKTPWYDDKTISRTIPFTPESQRYGDIFLGMLERQVLDQRIRFQEGEEQEMKARVSALAREAFSIFANVQPRPLPSSSTSSSSRGHQHSAYLSGSYTHLSTPQTTVGSQRRPSAYSLDNMHISSSPTENQIVVPSRPQRIMGPPPNSMRMQQGYGNMQGQPANIPGYQMPQMPMDFAQYPSYASSQPGQGSNTFFPMFSQSFDAGATSFAGGAVDAAFSGVSPQGMIDTPNTTAQDWELNFDGNLT